MRKLFFVYGLLFIMGACKSTNQSSSKVSKSYNLPNTILNDAIAYIVTGDSWNATVDTLNHLKLYLNTTKMAIKLSNQTYQTDSLGSLIFKADSDSGEVKLTLVASICKQSNSNQKYGYSATLLWNQSVKSGCAYSKYPLGLDGRWILTSIQNKTIQLNANEKVPQLTIDGKAAWFEAGGICNNLNGGLKLTRNTFGVSTLNVDLACTNPYEMAYFTLLKQARTYNLNNQQLTLTTPDGKSLSFLKATK